jgi:hypothetical protein
MAKIHGKNGSLTLGSLILYAVEYSVNFSREYVDTSVFGDRATVKYAGLRSFEGSFQGLYNTTADESVAAYMTDAPVAVTLKASPAVTILTGAYAWVDVSVTSSVSDAVKVSGTFKSTGAWF